MDIKKKPKIARASAVKKSPKAVKLSKNPKRVAGKNRTIQMVNPTESSLTISDRLARAEKIAFSHSRRHFFARFKNLRNMRKLVVAWLMVISVLILSVGLTRDFGRSQYVKNDFTSGGTFTEGILGEVKTLNPIFATTLPEKAFSRLAFSQLFRIDSSGALQGDLTDDILTSNNYRDFDLKLRQNILWSDGQKLTANDVIFTIDLLRNSSVNPAQYKSWRNVKATATDDYTIKFSMPTESYSVLYSLAFPILPKHSLENIPAESLREYDFTKNMVTSGAFDFKSMTKSGENYTINLTANKKYYRGAPRLAGYEISTYKTKDEIKKALISGEILASSNVTLSDFSDKERAVLAENQTSINRGVYAFMNTDDSILKDVKVRRAIQAGVDIAKVRQQMSAVEVIDYPVLSDFLNTDSINPPKFDKSEAEKILDEAGWKKGDDGVRTKDGQKLRISIATVDNKNLSAAAKQFESQLKELGFDVEMTIGKEDDQSGSFLQSVLQPRNYGILLYEIDLGADPDIYAFWHSSQANEDGLNLANYSDSVADDILINIRAAKTEQARRSLLTDFTKRWLRNAPAIGVAQTKVTFVYRKSVKSYDNSRVRFVSELDRYSDVIFWQVNKTDLYKTP